MNQKVHNQIVSFIWSIADDVLRDVFVRGKYRDIILPFTVLRRLDALLVPTKDKVLEANAFLIQQNIDDIKTKSHVPSFDQHLQPTNQHRNRHRKNQPSGQSDRTLRCLQK